MRLNPEEQAIAVIEAIRGSMNRETGMANVPDVVIICVASGIERTLAYKIIERWNNICWRRIGTSIGLMSHGEK